MGKKLRQIARNVDLEQPEKVLAYTSFLGSPNTKNLLAAIYQRLCGHHSIHYEKPKYSLVDSTTRVPEACKLIEAGFDYVTEMEDIKIFKKRK